jgi:hypothetical protein
VEHEEALKTRALVSEFSDSVEAEVDDLLTDCVVTAGEVVGSVLLSGNELFGVEQLSVGSRSDLVDDSGFEVEEDCSGNVFTSSGFGEESVESIVASANGFVGGHLTVGLDAMLEAEELPTGVADLNTSLANVDGDNLSHISNFQFI